MSTKNNTRFLLIDDSATMRRILRATLMRFGYVLFTEAETGQEAIEKICEAFRLCPDSASFDCILTDWNMPGKDGLCIVKEIRKIPGYSTIPIIMITTEREKVDVLQALMSGINAYIVKPFKPETLQEKIELLLGNPATVQVETQ